MLAAARLTDSITGTDTGEHTGHDPPHTAVPITGQISGGCSPNVFINTLQAATVDSISTEHDDCCGTSLGKVAAGSGTVFINGKQAARIGDALQPHNGKANISGGSENVFIGG